MAKSEKSPTEGNGGTSKGPKIEWDSSDLKNSYANVCNVSSTREEVVLLFGINEAFAANQDKVNIKLNNRVILNPVAAKRLQELLGRVMKEYEGKFGELPTGSVAQQTPKQA